MWDDEIVQNKTNNNAEISKSNTQIFDKGKEWRNIFLGNEYKYGLNVIPLLFGTGVIVADAVVVVIVVMFVRIVLSVGLLRSENSIQRFTKMCF